IQTGGIDDVAGLERSPARSHAASLSCDVRRPEPDVDALALRVGLHGLDDEQRIDGRGARREQRPLVRLHARLDLLRVGLGELLERDAVRAAAAQKLVERRDVRSVLRDDELSAGVQRDALLLAIGRQPLVAETRELGLQAVGRVVETGVQHTAVAAAAVRAAEGFLLDQDDTSGRLAPTQLAGDRQSDDAAADDQEIAGFYCRRSTVEGAAFWTIGGSPVEDAGIRSGVAPAPA